nr:hypothetical protein [Tanacetum cinerariifolium]
MDSIIPLGQKNTLVEYMILSGVDNLPPMLDKDLYDSWKSRMELYMKSRENRRMILESVENGLLIWPTIEEKWVTRTKKYVELSATEKIQADCDMKATNIILQDSGLAVHVFKQEDDPIDAINKMMSFFSTVITYHFSSTNNQLRNSSNPRQQATIHDGRVIVQPLQGRQNSYTAGEGHMARQCPKPKRKIDATWFRDKVLLVEAQGKGKALNEEELEFLVDPGEGHMARQCLKPKRKRDATWFRDKVLLVKSQGSGKVLNEKELEFLVDPGVAEGPVIQTVITYNAIYQADDLDAYASDCDDFSIAKAVLMANFSSYGSDVLSKDKNSSAQQNAMILSVFKQLSNQVTNYNKVNKDNLIANESLSAELERYVKFLEERQNVNLSTREKLIMDDIIQEKDA